MCGRNARYKYKCTWSRIILYHESGLLVAIEIYTGVWVVWCVCVGGGVVRVCVGGVVCVCVGVPVHWRLVGSGLLQTPTTAVPHFS